MSVPSGVVPARPVAEDDTDRGWHRLGVVPGLPDGAPVAPVGGLGGQADAAAVDDGPPGTVPGLVLVELASGLQDVPLHRRAAGRMQRLELGDDAGVLRALPDEEVDALAALDRVVLGQDLDVLALGGQQVGADLLVLGELPAGGVGEAGLEVLAEGPGEGGIGGAAPALSSSSVPEILPSAQSTVVSSASPTPHSSMPVAIRVPAGISPSQPVPKLKKPATKLTAATRTPTPTSTPPTHRRASAMNRNTSACSAMNPLRSASRSDPQRWRPSPLPASQLWSAVGEVRPAARIACAACWAAATTPSRSPAAVVTWPPKVSRSRSP